MKKRIIFFGLFLFFTNVVLAQKPSSNKNKYSIGIGIGIPYGSCLGINGDVALLPYMSISAGISVPGRFLGAENDFGYNIGLKFYPSSDFFILPRISIYYGVNYHIEIWGWGTKETNYYNGISLGPGLQLMFGKKFRFGIDFDIFYLLTSEGFQAKEDLKHQYPKLEWLLEVGRFQPSLGIRIGF